MLVTGKRQRSKGFLLLEIMISVSILSLGVLLVLNSFVKPIRAARLSKNYFKASLLLEEKILELYNSGIEEGASRGGFSCFDNRFSWDLGVVRTEDGFCKEVNLKVLWREKDKEKDLSILTYI